MRVIAGSMGGRQFAAPPGHRTHPMGDKVRGALFSILGDISGLTVLDAFAGSGALSFEAISRGASHATAIELDKNAQKLIKENIEKLKIEGKVHLIHGNCKGWSARNKDKQFDLVFCDPPYDAVLIGTIQKLSDHVKKDGILVLSWPSFLEVPELEGCKRLTNRRYASAQLIFFTRTV